MGRYAVTRSTATLFMVVGVAILLALAAAMPFARVNPMTIAFAGMIVVGAGMLLRERVLVRVERCDARRGLAIHRGEGGPALWNRASTVSVERIPELG